MEYNELSTSLKLLGFEEVQAMAETQFSFMPGIFTLEEVKVIVNRNTANFSINDRGTMHYHFHQLIPALESYFENT